MYIPSRPPLSTSSTSNSRQRRPDLSLIKSPRWSYSNSLERSYPSPPMSESPISPRRQTLYPDDRSSGTFPAPSSSAQPRPRPIFQSHRQAMEGPMLAVPPVLQPQYYGQGHGYLQDPRPELQPRPHTGHLPYPPQHYDSYLHQGQQPLPLVPSSRTPMPGTASFQGPTSLGSSSGPRIQRSTRRTKAHVAKACQNCKKAHLSCDVARPCARCVSSGKQATCVDVEHKKRGRPRLRDDREQRLEQAAAAVAAAAVQSLGQPEGLSRGHRRNDSLRILRSQAYGEDVSDDSRPEISQGMAGVPSYAPMGGPVAGYGSQFSSSPPQSRGIGSGLSAFLNLNLQVLKASEGLRSLLGGASDIIDRSLVDFVSPQYDQGLQRVQNELRTERTQREPQYLPAIFPEEQERAIVRDHDTEEADTLSRGFNDRVDVYNFRLASGHIEQYEVRIRLARTSTFFATMTMRRVVPPPAPIAPSPYARGGAYIQMPPTISPAHSPYPTSSPESAFSTLPAALMTTLPPRSSIPPAYAYTQTGARTDYGYFGRPGPQPQGMYPPPPPPPRMLSSEQRPSSVMEPRRPGPLEQVQLAPIVSSAPSTPMTQFFETGVPTPVGSASRRRSPEQTASDTDEEETRKRRRLNIGEIIDK